VARRAARRAGELTRGTLVLDSEGLALAVRDDRYMAARLLHARDNDIRVVVSTLTVIEAQDPRLSSPRLDYVLSKLAVEEVTKDITKEAVRLLRATGLHGHKYAIDAVVAATAMRQQGPITLVTSDVDDMAKLCDKRILLVRV
jgi:predicted nucleic acid-binding protein